MQGAQKLRSEAHLRVRRNDEVEAQRRRWTFYEVIRLDRTKETEPAMISPGHPNLEQEEEVVRFCRDLLRIRTVNPPGDERAAAVYIAEALEKAGLEVEMVTHTAERASVFARLRGKGEAAALLFSGHIDTVPAGREDWVQDPFGAAVAGGRIFGRGAADMKGGLAALMSSLKILAEGRFPLRGDILFAATAGEEIDSLGARAVASRKDLGPVQAVLIPEPSDNELFIAEKGALWLELITRGKTAHGSMPELGRNAVMMMIRLIDGFSRLEIPFKPHPLLDGFSRSVNTFVGGVKTNVVPDFCTATVDMRTVPGQDHRAVLEQVEELIRRLGKETPDFSAAVKILNDRAPVETPADHPAVGVFSEALREASGRPVVPKGTRYFTDGEVLAPALNVPLLICGPGSPALAHQPNEYVEIEKLREAVRVYNQAVLRFLG
jgi:succinyl-diaminopimelate desuccinylase